MPTFSNSPKLLKGGLVSIDPQTAAVQQVIVLQYNPESISRSFQVQGAGESGDRSQALRLRGPAVETLKLEARIDAIDQLEEGDAQAAELGVHPQIAALEAMIYPTSAQLIENDTLAASGNLEIVPMETPLLLLVWSKQRILPVRITDLSVTEEAFDTLLNPIRAKVSIGLRVLSVDDLGFDHKGGSLFISYLQQKESLAAKSAPGVLATLGDRRYPLTDPLKALLALPELAATAFPPSSRYHAVGTAVRETEDGTLQIYLKRRFVPDPSRLALLQTHTVVLGDRLDRLAAVYLADPELFWRICDANGALSPADLVEELGRKLRICQPEGVPGASDG